jgi:ribonucleotide reductase alpha subunit
MRHRPVGIGVQGLADAFLEMKLPYDSPAARKLNKQIFETIYFGAVTRSNAIAKEDGPYKTYEGSPISQGQFQHDLWGVKPDPELNWDWAGLRAKVLENGVRNSLLLAPMPTASTSQILGNNECFEPYTSNIYTRRVLAGEFTVVNKHLLSDLIERGLWTDSVRNQIIADRGSVQNVHCIPDDVKELYKTVWEIKQRAIIDMAADRGAFIDQSQSLNIHLAEPNIAKLTSMHFYAWKKGLKTGLYYLRTRPKADAIQFTVDQAQLKESRALNDPKAEKKEGETPASPMKQSPSRPPKSPFLNKAAEEQAGVRRNIDGSIEQEECLMCGS